MAVRNFAGSLDGTLTTRFGQCRVPCSLEPQNRPQKKTSGLMAQNLLVMLLVPGLLELAGAYPGLGQELIQITQPVPRWFLQSFASKAVAKTGRVAGYLLYWR